MVKVRAMSDRFVDDIDYDLRDRTNIFCREYQGKLIRELAQREGRRIVEVLDEMILLAYRKFGYNVDSVEETMRVGIKSRWARGKY